MLVHPWDMMTDGRMKRWMLPWLVAMPAETQLGILSLILSGAFEAHSAQPQALLRPWRRQLRLPAGPGRQRLAPPRHRAPGLPQLPSSYTDRFYVDSAVFDPRSLRLLIDVMGEDRVLLGSDYPYPLGEQEVGRLVSNADLLPAVQQKILSGNTQTFFGLDR